MNNIKATKKIKNYDILFFDELCYNINIIQLIKLAAEKWGVNSVEELLKACGSQIRTF